MTRTAVAALLVLAGAAVAAGQANPPEWRSFKGRWSAVGERETLPTERGRDAVVVHLSGTLVLTTGEGLSRGFRAEAIAFDDGGTVTAGRAVWTDANGDRIFSVLKGETVETGRRIDAAIAGGTGRYDGLVGTYSFTWQYVLSAEPSVVQGRAADLEGRFRLGEARR